MEDVLDAAQVRVRGHRLHHQQFYPDADRLLADLAVSARNCYAGQTELSRTGFSLCAFRWTQQTKTTQTEACYRTLHANFALSGGKTRGSARPWWCRCPGGLCRDGRPRFWRRWKALVPLHPSLT